jgi:hypothetical protein
MDFAFDDMYGWLVLVLNRGGGKFFRCSNDFITQKVYFSLLMRVKKFKNWPRPLFGPRADHACHQKPNPSRETVPLSRSAAQDLMWTDARDMWYLAVDSCWAEFLLLPRPLPLIDALPLAAWLYAKPKGKLHLLLTYSVLLSGETRLNVDKTILS